MRHDGDGQSTKAEATSRPATNRAEVVRARFHVAARKDAPLAAGGKPSEDGASRMVSEFHAKGGRVTVCPPADEAPPGAEEGRGETR